MLQHGTYLVADIYNDDYILAEYTRLGYPDKIIEKERKVSQPPRASTPTSSPCPAIRSPISRFWRKSPSS